MGGLPALNSYVNYKEDSLYGGWLYGGNTVVSKITFQMVINFFRIFYRISMNWRHGYNCLGQLNVEK